MGEAATAIRRNARIITRVVGEVIPPLQYRIPMLLVAANVVTKLSALPEAATATRRNAKTTMRTASNSFKSPINGHGLPVALETVRSHLRSILHFHNSRKLMQNSNIEITESWMSPYSCSV